MVSTKVHLTHKQDLWRKAWASLNVQIDLIACLVEHICEIGRQRSVSRPSLLVCGKYLAEQVDFRKSAYHMYLKLIYLYMQCTFVFIYPELSPGTPH